MCKIQIERHERITPPAPVQMTTQSAESCKYQEGVSKISTMDVVDEVRLMVEKFK